MVWGAGGAVCVLDFIPERQQTTPDTGIEDPSQKSPFFSLTTKRALPPAPIPGDTSCVGEQGPQRDYPEVGAIGGGR